MQSIPHSTSADRPALVDARRHARFKLEANICVYPRNAEVVRGHTVDISESGVSAMLRGEVPLNEVVRLTFSVPAGEVEIHSLVRQRNAFRYGFQFVEGGPASALIRRTCRELSLNESLRDNSNT
ncbi:MAG TPA: PilZ domain-containing protein [Candidatus Sulfotelmatobacter sp.]|nr:PilZ domain-containing protein [Candidatus Sulfotelmatobacter sp.]